MEGVFPRRPVSPMPVDEPKAPVKDVSQAISRWISTAMFYWKETLGQS